ncbi:hypothetical protein [Actinokineospora sp.]|uniref:hypothetical protein n=1 Tax=Actinokineospora sp. TaxID=1872133 RepID=UPI004037E9E2
MTQQENDAAWPGLPELYQWWWLHDARWYQEVATKFGTDVANELNASAVAFVAKRIGSTVRKTLGRPVEELSMAELVEVYRTCAEAMFPAGMITWDIQPTGVDSFKVEISKSFAVDMLRRAGSLETYACPCLETREGWFAGLGAKFETNEVVSCLRKGDACCTMLGTVAQPAAGDPR